MRAIGDAQLEVVAQRRASAARARAGTRSRCRTPRRRPARRGRRPPRGARRRPGSAGRASCRRRAACSRCCRRSGAAGSSSGCPAPAAACRSRRGTAPSATRARRARQRVAVEPPRGTARRRRTSTPQPRGVTSSIATTSVWPARAPRTSIGPVERVAAVQLRVALEELRVRLPAPAGVQRLEAHRVARVDREHRRRAPTRSTRARSPRRAGSRAITRAAPGSRRPPARAARAGRCGARPRRGTPRATTRLLVAAHLAARPRPARSPPARAARRPRSPTAFGSCSFSGSRTSASRRPGANASSCSASSAVRRAGELHDAQPLVVPAHRVAGRRVAQPVAGLAALEPEAQATRGRLRGRSSPLRLPADLPQNSRSFRAASTTRSTDGMYASSIFQYGYGTS